MLNVATAPQLLTLGVGKRASAYVIEAASMAYKEKGYKFYFTDEREEDGTVMARYVVFLISLYRAFHAFGSSCCH